MCTSQSFTCESIRRKLIHANIYAQTYIYIRICVQMRANAYFSIIFNLCDLIVGTSFATYLYKISIILRRAACVTREFPVLQRVKHQRRSRIGIRNSRLRSLLMAFLFYFIIALLPLYCASTSSVSSLKKSN